MKKDGLKNLLILLLLGIIAYLFYNQSQEPAKDDVVVEEPVEPVEPKMEDPRNLIEIDKAKGMQQRYVDTRVPVLERALGYEDNRDFAFTVAELDRYIHYVKNNLGEEIDYNKVNIRFYLSVYSPADLKSLSIVDNPEDFPEGLATVFMAPDANHNNEIQKGGFFNIKPYYSLEPDNLAQSGRPPKKY